MSRRFSSLILIAAPALAAIAACGGGEQRNTPVASASKPTASAPSDSVATESSAIKPDSIIAESTTVTASYEDGEAAFRAGRYRDAQSIFAAYVQAKPDNPWGYYMLGLSAWKSGDLGRAEEAFDQALTLDPRHRKSMLNSTRVLLELGRPQEALSRVEEALTIEPMSGEALRLLGRAYHELGQTEEAIAAYHRALSVDENDAWSMNNLGLLYIQLGRYEEALPPLARAVELRSTSPVFQNNLGIALERSGHYAAARRAYEAALAADSTYGKASASLARVRAQPDTAESQQIDLAALAQAFREQTGTGQDSMGTQ